MKMATECGVAEDEYQSCLRGYGNWTRKELRSKMRIVRKRELAKLKAEVFECGEMHECGRKFFR